MLKFLGFIFFDSVFVNCWFVLLYMLCFSLFMKLIKVGFFCFCIVLSRYVCGNIIFYSLFWNVKLFLLLYFGIGGN